MTSNDFQSSFTVGESPHQVFAAVTNPKKWWTGDIEGAADKMDDEFSYRYGDLHYSKQKITEIVPDQKVVWRVLDSNLPGNEDPQEWTGTNITFEIAQHQGQTELRFSHRGLVPESECFNACSGGWTFFINGSLKHLITTGEGPATPPWA